jgi:Zn-dependent protease
MGLLRFRLFGANVHIRPGFWLVVLALVTSTQRPWFAQVLLGLTLLLTLLVHEMGHALTARRLGLDPIILIHAFGGATSFLPTGVPGRAAAIRIALAGPSAGLLMALAGVLALKFGPHLSGHPWSSAVRGPLTEFIQINGFWSLVNLLPVMPFDGGQVLVYLLGPNRILLAGRISLGFGLVAAVILHRLGLDVAAIVFAIASVIQYLLLRKTHSKLSDAVAPQQVELLLGQARKALADGDADSAMRMAKVVVEVARTPKLRRQGAEVFAWAALGKADLDGARLALDWLSDGSIDPLLQAAILEADGDCERAVHCLRQARVVGDDRPQVAASLVRLLLGIDRYGEAALTTIQILDHVSVEEARLVVRACRDGSRPIPAAELSEALFARTSDVEDLLSSVASYVAAGNREAARSTLALAMGGNVTAEAIKAHPQWSELASEPDLASALGEQTVESGSRVNPTD